MAKQRTWQVDFESVSDVGLKRKSNEDSYCVNHDEGLYVVADGMGGHAAGEVASGLAVSTIEDYIKFTSVKENASSNSGLDGGLTPNGRRLKTSIYQANQRLLEYTQQRAECDGMATTIVAVLVEEGVAEIAHVGDSRVYLIRDNAIRCMTTDHSWVNEQVQSGMMDTDQARHHPLRNVVTRAIGGDTILEVDVQSIELELGDRLLLCSDGLPSMVADDEILQIVLSDGGSLKQAEKLVKAANLNGGEDNTTAVLLWIH